MKVFTGISFLLIFGTEANQDIVTQNGVLWRGTRCSTYKHRCHSVQQSHEHHTHHTWGLQYRADSHSGPCSRHTRQSQILPCCNCMAYTRCQVSVGCHRNQVSIWIAQSVSYVLVHSYGGTRKWNKCQQKVSKVISLHFRLNYMNERY